MKKKILGLAAVLFSGLLFIPTAFAWTSSVDGYGAVSDNTSPDSYVGSKPTPAGEETAKDVVLTYDSASLKIVEGDPVNAAGVREPGYAWIGFKVTVPGNVNSDTYKVFYKGEEYDEGIKNASSYTEWVGVSEEKLKANIGGTIEYTFGFDWDSDDGVDQTVTIKINTMGVTLYPEDSSDDSDALWTPEIAKAELAAINAAQNTTTTEAQSDDVPKTGDSLPIALIGIVLLGTLSGIYTYKQIKE